MHPIKPGSIYIATVLLELNRWTKEKIPTFQVSEWLDRFAQAGFDGVEIWENHAVKAPDDEVARLAAGPLPVTIFNSYAKLDDASKAERDLATRLALRLGAAAIKFNFGNDPALRDESVRNVKAWLADLPANFHMICECHPNTLAEEPENAFDLFQAVGDPRLEALVHPIRMEDDNPKKLRADFLRKWFEIFGKRITHTHIQTRPERIPQVIEEAFDILREKNFSGTHALEFTVGTRTPGETIDILWKNALEDLQIIRKCIA